MNRIKKRTGKLVEYNPDKIKNAIIGANSDIENHVTNAEIEAVYDRARIKAESILEERDVSVEEINDIVEKAMIRYGCYELVKQFIEYRYRHKLIRESNTTDESIFELINGKSEYWNDENSNKNAKLLTTQRDYIAGITSTDIARRFVFPKKSIETHDQGIIHIHDMDYAAEKQRINCCLVNLDDMLQNGTVLNGIKIEKPHRFITACTIATQIIVAVSASNYGGTTITLTHLAPFVRYSFYRHYKFYMDNVLQHEMSKYINPELPMDDISYKSEECAYIYAKKQLQKEIEDGVQTFNYQVNSMSSTNGQAPFLSVCMYLGETDGYKEELAMIIEEFLKQRIQGMKNPQGVYVTVAFPKLLYVLEEDNIRKGSKYWYLTELAAKCSAKRLVPDYISEKVMKEYKVNQINGEGDAYPCMGCVDGKEVITYKFYDFLFVESFERMWEKLSSRFEVKLQSNKKDFYMDLRNVKIYDKENGFVETKRIIKNKSTNWVKVKMTNGRILTCTEDHPFVTERGRVYAKDLIIGDKIPFEFNQYSENFKKIDTNLAWAYGVLLCDSAYSSNIIASFALNGEDEIITKLSNVLSNEYSIDFKIQEQHRGEKGDYKDLKFYKADTLKYKLISMFEGISKNTRHIPNEVFSWNEDAKYAFLAGMIDADGYINNARKMSKVQIESINKELSYQQLALIQALGMRGHIYENHYSTKNKSKIRYRVEFIPNKKILNFITCEKKKKHFENCERTNYSSAIENFGFVKEVVYLNIDQYSYDVTTESDHFDVSGIYSHNCRSFLTPDRIKGNPAKSLNYNPNKGKYYGRFNMGVASVNIPAVAVLSKGDLNEFWKLLDNYCELCHDVLKVRVKRLEECTSNIAPILYQYGAFARLDRGESLKPLIYGGYATISLGYAGLYETIKFFTGKSNTEKEGIELQKRIMQFLNDKCNEWKKAENIDYSLYGTPIENTVGKFAKAVHKLDKDFFVKIDGKDRDFVTNSYHVFVEEEINAFDKLALEGEYQKLSPGGCISYVESADLTQNVEVVLELLRFMYDHTMYAEINTKSDYCQVCGYDKEIEIVDCNHKLKYHCPNCGNTDDKKMNVARRVCGYISTNIPNQARLEEIANRYVHVDNHE